MPPTRGHWRPQRGIVLKPLPKRPKEQSLFERYHYPFLLAIFCATAFLVRGLSFTLREAVIYGLWVALFTAFVWQVYLYLRSRQAPASAKSAAPPAKKPLPPVVKPIHPGKDAGQQRPKPFITGVKPKPGVKPQP